MSSGHRHTIFSRLYAPNTTEGEALMIIDTYEEEESYLLTSSEMTEELTCVDATAERLLADLQT